MTCWRGRVNTQCSGMAPEFIFLSSGLTLTLPTYRWLVTQQCKKIKPFSSPKLIQVTVFHNKKRKVAWTTTYIYMVSMGEKNTRFVSISFPTFMPAYYCNFLSKMDYLYLYIFMENISMRLHHRNRIFLCKRSIVDIAFQLGMGARGDFRSQNLDSN